MGDNLKILRKKANLTQSAAAEKLGIRQSTIAMWETGQCVPRTKMLQKIAEIYQCTVSDIVNEGADLGEALC
jgi:transcriptional regulator with XRE-family HTH domain